MADDKTVIHVTHETTGKVGGIGSVLAGFFTSKAYLDAFKRSIVVGPLFFYEGPLQSRLGDDVEVLYSSRDGCANTPFAQAFRRIEEHFHTAIIYGKRTFQDNQTGITSCPELLLIDVRIANKEPVNYFKKQLFENFGIRSDLYENIWEYEQYVRLAPVAMAALRALCALHNNTTVIAHEFMGMPTALAAILDKEHCIKTVFYAHEVATVRNIIEKHTGHDTMFYNVLKYSLKNKFYISEVFGDQSSYFKHPLIEASKYCDHIFAVGDYVADELRFLAPEFDSANINVVYNGIPACRIDPAEKLKSKQKLQKYCENILGFNPDYIFTHVTRLVKSKGLWRDLQVLEQIEKQFQKTGQTAVLLLLSTEVSKRPPGAICEMERAYNWPVAHREGWPDLSGGEADFYTAVQQFNAKSRNIKVVFINQFGFSRQACGAKMPADMTFVDIRKGSDVEFGMSIYEPFGISHLESLTFGAICVLSNVCGCTGLVRDLSFSEEIPNVIIADYINLQLCSCDSIENLAQIDSSVRLQIENCVSEKVASQILAQLSNQNNHAEKLTQTGYNLARNMSWNIIVQNYILPALQNPTNKQYLPKAYSSV